jgi:DNA invertase Pin-like site-specific DNA recombinase
MLGVFAEFETSLRKERQLEGIAKAKAKGVYKGKQPLSDSKKKEVIDLFKDGLKQVEIVKQTHLGRTTVHSILKAAGVK